MEKRTILSSIEISQEGQIQIRIGLLLVEDGVEMDCKWHRTIIEAGSDIDAQFALVNQHLSEMGRAAVSIEEIQRVKAVAAVL